MTPVDSGPKGIPVRNPSSTTAPDPPQSNPSDVQPCPNPEPCREHPRTVASRQFIARGKEPTTTIDVLRETIKALDEHGREWADADKRLCDWSFGKTITDLKAALRHEERFLPEVDENGACIREHCSECEDQQ